MSWIEFKEMPQLPGRRTKNWELSNSSNGTVLGYVGWDTRFRKYAFFPSAGTVHNATCLQDIANFLQEKTNEHRAKIQPQG